MSRIQPLNDRVIVLPAEASDKTQAGIIIPDTAKEKPSRGTVIAVGQGMLASTGELLPMQVQEGDMVMYRPLAGTEITVDGATHLILRESEILAVL